MQPDPPQGAEQHVGHRSEPKAELVGSHRRGAESAASIRRGYVQLFPPYAKRRKLGCFTERN
jgi:hypothetical protein